VGGGVGEGQRRLLRQLLHAALTLREEIQQLQTVRVCQRLPQNGELGVEAILECPVAHLSPYQVIKKSIEHYSATPGFVSRFLPSFGDVLAN
jgi:hypothetical protein